MIGEKNDARQICLNGHHITYNYHRFPESRERFCTKCGAATIYKCQNPQCNKEIKGAFLPTPGSNRIAIALGDPDPPPLNCPDCGTPYPWANKKKILKITSLLLHRRVLAPLVGIVGVILILILPSLLSWDWLEKHPNRLGLYLWAFAIWGIVIWGIIDKKHRSLAFFSVFVPIVGVVFQIVGR